MPKKNINETVAVKPTNIAEYYDDLKFRERDKFRKTVMEKMGWSYPQWRNRIARRTQLSPAEVIVLELITGQKHTP